MRTMPSAVRSGTRGQHAATGPMPVMISRSGRCPWRTCPFRKFHPVQIRAVRQNHRIIRVDAFEGAKLSHGSFDLNYLASKLSHQALTPPLFATCRRPLRISSDLAYSPDRDHQVLVRCVGPPDVWLRPVGVCGSADWRARVV